MPDRRYSGRTRGGFPDTSASTASTSVWNRGRQKRFEAGAIGGRRVGLPVPSDGMCELLESLYDLLHEAPGVVGLRRA